jgi:hypothetical protein
MRFEMLSGKLRQTRRVFARFVAATAAAFVLGILTPEFSLAQG